MIFQDRSVLKPAIDSKEFLNYICYKHQKHNLLTLRDVVGEAGMVNLIDKFAGTYIRFPTASQVLKIANDIFLCQLYNELKRGFSSGDPIKWHEAEQRFIKFAERQGMNYLTAKKFCKDMNIKISEANEWINNIKLWQKRNTETEN